MNNYSKRIYESGLGIYDVISPTDPLFYIPTNELEQILDSGLRGISLAGLPLRTRSKTVKTEICKTLGYPIPRSFVKTQPRFVGQNFDVYTQKSLNLQIWNEEIDPERRYVLIRVDDDDIIRRVKVLTGDQLAIYDNTGTLTTKYQATMRHFGTSRLLSLGDTPKIQSLLAQSYSRGRSRLPNSSPVQGEIMPIEAIYESLLPLVGTSLQRMDALQERNRGAELHRGICQHLGYGAYTDDGTYPDILNQLIEIKLQMSPTIDLGLHSPNEEKPFTNLRGLPLQSADIRYVIFDAGIDPDNSSLIRLNHLYVVTGADFAVNFPLFGGKVQNAKIQLPLPLNFFD